MEDIEKISAILIQELGAHVEFMYIFGSAAHGKLQAESDIDVAIYVKNLDEFPGKFIMVHQLEKLLHRDVDLILMNQNDPIILAQILANGKLILDKNPTLRVKFAAQKHSEYIDFKRSREIVEKNILRRKTNA